MRRGHGDGRQGDNASDRKDLLRKIGQLIFIRHGEKVGTSMLDVNIPEHLLMLSPSVHLRLTVTFPLTP